MTIMKKILLIVLLNTQILYSQNLNNLVFGSDSTFEVVSWNIEWFPKNNSTANYVETILNNINADIYALQEIEDTTLLKQVVSNLSGYECHFKSSYYGGLAYVYKNTIQINSIYEIYKAQPFWNIFPRKPQVLDLQYNDERYIIINNHFKCCGDGVLDTNDTSDEENRRLLANTLLKEYIDNNFSNIKVIMLGDLNDNLTDPVNNNVFNQFIEDDYNYLFTDMPIAQGNNNNWSYPTWPSHLDHILISNELFSDFQNPNSSINVIRVDDHMGSWSNYENNISDHRPVGLKLEISRANNIKIEDHKKKKIIKIIDALGREVNTTKKGLLFYIYESGEVIKIIH